MVGQFPPHVGGVGVHIHTLSKELVKQGHEVYVITYPHKNIEDIDGIHVIGTKGVNIPGIRGLMFKINAKKALENLLKEVDIDIIHGHYLFPAGAASVEVGKKHGIKTYITAHGSDMFEMYKKQFFMRPIIKKVLKKADLIRENRKKNFIYYDLNTSVVEELLLWLKDLKGDESHDEKI